MKRRRQDQGGFALLLVFLMAASIAIFLYTQMPRVAFESERQKEQLLEERGEQYTRAIQLYVRKFKKYPASMDDLEKSNNVRFLRQKYVDPMTGKDDWRIIHVGPNGVLTDSLVQKKDDKKQETVDNFIGPAKAFVGTDPTLASNQNPALRRRPSEGGGTPTDGSLPTTSNSGGQMGAPGVGGVAVVPTGVVPWAPTPVVPPGTAGGVVAPSNVLRSIIPIAQPGVAPGVPGGVNPANAANGARGANGQQAASQSANSFIGGGGSFIGGSPTPTPAPQAPPMPNQNGMGQMNGQLVPGQPNGVNAMGGAVPPPPGSMPMAPGGVNPAQSIMNGLMRPAAAGTGMPGNRTMGAGIAGVASKYEAEGVMIRNDRSKINEWEFIYDPSKEKVPGKPAAPTPGQTQPNQNQSQSQSSFGSPATQFSGSNPSPNPTPPPAPQQ